MGVVFNGMELTVGGFGGKENRLFYHCPPRPTNNVVYFPGDVQDLQANMESQYYDISQWSPWCLEKTCSLLQTKFPTSAIWLVQPHTFLRHLFSSFHNFVESTLVGVPTFSDQPKAIPHLARLLSNATHSLSDTAELSEVTFNKLPVTLIGFSKGCVVLNQILYELVNYINTESTVPLPTTEGDTKDLIDFVHQIKSIYWLDSGHSGESGCWVCDRDVLQSLAVLDPQVYVHVTSYQVKYPQRLWIGEEETQFVDILRELGLNIHETYHFRDESRTLLNHFKILNVF